MGIYFASSRDFNVILFIAHIKRRLGKEVFPSAVLPTPEQHPALSYLAGGAKINTQSVKVVVPEAYFLAIVTNTVRKLPSGSTLFSFLHLGSKQTLDFSVTWPLTSDFYLFARHQATPREFQSLSTVRFRNFVGPGNFLKVKFLRLLSLVPGSARSNAECDPRIGSGHGRPRLNYIKS